MTNRERLNSLTDEEIAKSLCYLVQEVLERVDIMACCKFCPVRAICSQEENGFKVWLNQEETKDDKKI